MTTAWENLTELTAELDSTLLSRLEEGRINTVQFALLNGYVSTFADYARTAVELINAQNPMTLIPLRSGIASMWDALPDEVKNRHVISREMLAEVASKIKPLHLDFEPRRLISEEQLQILATPRMPRQPHITIIIEMDETK